MGRAQTPPAGMLSVDAATELVLSHARAIDAVDTVGPYAAAGRVLAKPLLAPFPHPPFTASIKDGFAVRSADTMAATAEAPIELKVVGASRAGDATAAPYITTGDAAYITTGAPLPPGADAVIGAELVETDVAASGARAVAGASCVRVRSPASRGLEVRPIGFDIAIGSTLLTAGTRLGPVELGIAACAGGPALSVVRAPRVAVLSLGDELLEPHAVGGAAAPVPAPPTAGRIYDSNRLALISAAAAEGAEPVDLGTAADTAAAVGARIDAAIEAGADALVCSAGVSVGDRDMLGPTLASRGAVHFSKVWMKPGKPLTFATVPRKGATPLLVFGLPGNPVSCCVCFNLLVAPAIRAMLRLTHVRPRRVVVRTTAPLKLDPERPEYHRATISVGADGTLRAHSTGKQISSRLLSCVAAEALLELPAGAATLPAGTRVSALLPTALSGHGLLRPSHSVADDELGRINPLDPSLDAPSAPGPASAAPMRVVVVRRAGADGGPAADALSALLQSPPIANLEVARDAEAPALEAALRRACDGAEAGAQLVVAIESSEAPRGASLNAAVRAVADRTAQALGSVVRSAIATAAPAQLALDSWDAAARGRCLLLCLPASAAAAAARTLLPVLPDALRHLAE